jgi:hypothetical protein
VLSGPPLSETHSCLDSPPLPSPPTHESAKIPERRGEGQAGRSQSIQAGGGSPGSWQ